MQSSSPPSPKSSYFTPKGRLLSLITRVHRSLFVATGGLLGRTLLVMAEKGSRFPVPVRTMSVLLLTTTGRKSGARRLVPLPYFEIDGRLLLVASFAASPRHPDWYLNLEASPEVEIQLGSDVSPARATALEGEDRERMWRRLTASWPRYQVYQDATERLIPVVEIHLER